MLIHPSSQAKQPPLDSIHLLLGGLRAAYQRGINWLIRQPELDVRQHLTRGHHAYWQAYDPKTNQSFSVTSDSELRHRLELHDRHSMH